MNPSADINKREIATSELLTYTLRKWKWILLAALLAGALLFAWKMLRSGSGTGSVSSQDAETGSLEEALETYRTDRESYEKLIRRAEELLVENRSYLAQSILTQIDPAHAGKAVASVIISVPEENRNVTAGQLADLYAAFCTYRTDWTSLAEELGTGSAYLAELVSTVPSVSALSPYAGDTAPEMNGSARETLTVTIVHPDEETAGRMMDELIAQLMREADSQKEALGEHQLTVASRSCGSYADATLGSRTALILQEIYNLSTNEERLSAQLAKLKKPAADAGGSSSSRLKGAVKYGIIGFVGGAVLMTLFLMALFTLSGKILSASELSRLFGLPILFSAPGRKGGASFRSRPDSKSPASGEERYRYAAQRILNRDASLKNLLLTGDVSPNVLSGCAEALSLSLAAAAGKGVVPQVRTTQSLTGNPEAISLLKKADGVILVEETGKSSFRAVSQDLAVLSEENACVLGVITL